MKHYLCPILIFFVSTGISYPEEFRFEPHLHLTRLECGSTDNIFIEYNSIDYYIILYIATSFPSILIVLLLFWINGKASKTGFGFYIWKIVNDRKYGNYTVDNLVQEKWYYISFVYCLHYKC